MTTGYPVDTKGVSCMDLIHRPAPTQIEPRPAIMKKYVQNQLRYAELMFPDVDPSILESIIREDAKQSLKRPNGTVLVYPEPGECDLKEVDLLTFISSHNHEVITPSGTFFKSDPDNLPPSVKYTDGCNKARSYFKKLMFACMEKGDHEGESNNDKRQALKKIKANSIIGGHGFVGNAFYDKECFGAITSLARNGVILAYGLTEQCLVNNFYWDKPETVLNYVTTAISFANRELIRETIDNKKLYVPTAEVAANRLLQSAKYYMSKPEINELRNTLIVMFTNMTEEQKTYVFYRRSLINMITFNEEYFRLHLDHLFSLDKYLQSRDDYQSLLDNTPPDAFFQVPEDIRMMLSVIYNNVLDYEPVNMDLVKNHPDKAKLFSLISLTAKEYLDYFESIYYPFMYSGDVLPAVLRNKYIIRKAVAVSDTDSVIFTMKTPVAWYTKGDLRVCHESLSMAAYTVYMLSKMLNVANRDLAISKGVVLEENVSKVNLKSEFLYPVLIKTDLAKHYFSKYIAKEGRMLKKPKLDVKGVGLQTSTLPEVTQDFSKKIYNSMIDEVCEHGTLCETDLIKYCLEYEFEIYNSLLAGKLDYYPNSSIKEKNQYKDPERSNYFNYTLWQEVFAPTYGDINLPGKFATVPFQAKIIRSEKYLTWLGNGYPDIHQRLLKFLSKIDPKKNISRIFLPVTVMKLPDPFIPAINLRSIIYKNMAPAQLAMRQIGINLGESNRMPLFMDVYGDLTDGSLTMKL